MSYDRLVGAVQDHRALLFVVGGRLRIESYARRACGTGKRLGVTWRGREGIPPGFVDRRRERRTGRPHEPVVLSSRRERERVRKRRVMALAEPQRSDVLQDATLRQAAISGNAGFMFVRSCNVTHLLASTREGIRAAYGVRPPQRPRASCRARSQPIAGCARSSSMAPAASSARSTKRTSA